MVHLNIPHPRDPRQRKSALMDLNLACLARGEWQMVVAITQLIQRRGWSHA
jgi:hypothetical protein